MASMSLIGAYVPDGRRAIEKHVSISYSEEVSDFVPRIYYCVECAPDEAIRRISKRLININQGTGITLFFKVVIVK